METGLVLSAVENKFMNPKVIKSYKRLLPGIVALVWCGLISVSAQAQASEDKAVTLVDRNEVGAAEVLTTKAPEPAPVPPVSSYSWKGPYIGGHLGYGWGRANTSFSPLPTAAQFINLAPTTLKPDPNGIFGGLQAGYNLQRGRIVAGVEGSFSGSRMSGTNVVVGFTQNNGLSWNGSLTAHQDTRWFGTFRGRAGFTPTSRVLLYGTAGLAYGHVHYSANADFRPQGPVQYPSVSTQTKTGWTAGAGVEVGLHKYWSWKAEYLYYDLGKQSLIGNPIPANPPFQVTYAWQTKVHTFSTGVNFRF
jgi:outer membrane immunogenic protein